MKFILKCSFWCHNPLELCGMWCNNPLDFVFAAHVLKTDFACCGLAPLGGQIVALAFIVPVEVLEGRAGESVFNYGFCGFAKLPTGAVAPCVWVEVVNTAQQQSDVSMHSSFIKCCWLVFGSLSIYCWQHRNLVVSNHWLLNMNKWVWIATCLYEAVQTSL